MFLGGLATPIYVWQSVVISMVNWTNYYSSTFFGYEAFNTNIEKMSVYLIATFCIAIPSFILVDNKRNMKRVSSKEQGISGD